MVKNWNCDGAHCNAPHGQVRVYPLGSGGNLILCSACFAHENRYRFERGKESGNPDAWPQVQWQSADVYATDESERTFAEMQSGPSPLSNAEIDKLADTRPELWARFRGRGKA